MSAPRLDIPQDTRRRQHLASHPAHSAWVSANAGSGKTHVLTQRVLRLLLEGVAPARILCLTFTKAAAANMSIRVFDTLARWTSLDDPQLRRALDDVGVPAPSDTMLRDARRLFARAVETPGGLKIQTIHAFCERLLHQFPFESDVPARFAVLDELLAAELLERARHDTLAEAVDDPDSDLGRAVTFLAEESTATTVEVLLEEVLTHRSRLVSAQGDAPASRAAIDATLSQLLSLAQDDTTAAIEAAMLGHGIPHADWAPIGQRLGGDGTATDTAANRLIAAALAAESDRLPPYLNVFLTAELEPRADRYLRAPVRRAHPELAARLDDERTRLAALVGRRLATQTRERTVALLHIAHAVLARYEAAKQMRGVLDFHDLVDRTRRLLRHTGSAWVLFKLDGGIDHVLVDEAQDTSPEQWDILRALTAEFFAGEARERGVRTFFAVGDEKQSIFSFQGARPAMFEGMQGHFSREATEARTRFERVALNLSFRSAPAILDVVDSVFAVPAHAAGLSASQQPPLPHVALKNGTPGLVQLWPALGPQSQPEPQDWRLPLDQVDPHAPPVVLAHRIAATIRSMTAAGSPETVADGAGRRPIRPGDVMILVRSRNAFFEAVIRALKEAQVPVAGADRLILTEHIAVMDLIAAGRASLLPDDDLTVACVLKSPLVGLDDDDLIALAPQRTGRLVEALDGSTVATHQAAAAQLATWRARARDVGPFAFFSRLLGADGGRKKMLARLGPEAGDAIDEFLALALAHERSEPPSLTAFLAHLEGEELSIKRDMEAAGDAVRVMTVHAAKGLESKIVFLPDTCAAPTGRHDPKLFVLGGEADDPSSGHLAWSPRQKLDVPPVAAARAALRRAAIEEYNRLLYVALTRAEERLYVCGFHGSRGIPDLCWYRMLEASDLGLTAVPAPWDSHETILERRDPGLDAPSSPQPATPSLNAALPDWLWRHPRHEISYAPPVRPSNVLAAADQRPLAPDGFDAERAGTRRHAALTGRLTHQLLQHLPGIEAARREEVARHLLATAGGHLEAKDQDAVLAAVGAVMAAPELTALFGPTSRAEVGIAGRVTLADGRPLEITGQIDRVAVTADTVEIADFKTGRAHDLATVPPNYVGQLALYGAAVAPLYPGKAVRAFLVFTSGPTVLELPQSRLDAALAELAAGGSRSGFTE